MRKEMPPAASAPEPRRPSDKEWARLRARRDARPSLEGDSVAIIRSMRDERSVYPVLNDDPGPCGLTGSEE